MHGGRGGAPLSIEKHATDYLREWQNVKAPSLIDPPLLESVILAYLKASGNAATLESLASHVRFWMLDRLLAASELSRLYFAPGQELTVYRNVTWHDATIIRPPQLQEGQPITSSASPSYLLRLDGDTTAEVNLHSFNHSPRAMSSADCELYVGKHVDALRVLAKVYVDPLRMVADAPKGVIFSHKDLDAIFLNITVIIKVNENFLE